MQSVIFCCNHEPLPEQLGREIPFCLLPLAGKPLIERSRGECCSSRMPDHFRPPL